MPMATGAQAATRQRRALRGTLVEGSVISNANAQGGAGGNGGSFLAAIGGVGGGAKARSTASSSGAGSTSSLAVATGGAGGSGDRPTTAPMAARRKPAAMRHLAARET